jgi:hypothetical protein
MDQDAGYRYQYYLTPTWVSKVELAEPSLAELARVIKAGVCIEASFNRGKGEAGMDAYQVRTWEGWHHHEVFCTLSIPYICRQVQRQLMRNELARLYHFRTRNCIPPKRLRRDIQ